MEDVAQHDRRIATPNLVAAISATRHAAHLSGDGWQSCADQGSRRAARGGPTRASSARLTTGIVSVSRMSQLSSVALGPAVSWARPEGPRWLLLSREASRVHLRQPD